MSNSSLDIQIQKTTNSRLKDFDQNNLKFGHTFSDHMFIADFSEGKWHSPRIVPFGDMLMSPANSMIHYGQSIFEGLKAFKAQNGDTLVFRPDMNAKRMQLSARRMCMAEVPTEYFIEGIRELLRIDEQWIPDTPSSSMYIRPFEFASDNFLGVHPSDSYRFMIILSPSGTYYRKDVKVKVEREFTRATKGGVGEAKTAANYAASLYPTKLAHEQGFDQLIWTDGKEHKFIEESGTMNFMAIMDGKLVTSPLTSTILAGVTRDSILNIARDWGMQVDERPVAVSELKAAMQENRIQEAFGVGTAATVAHISDISIDGENFTLPGAENREFSVKVKKYMDDLKRGRIEDERNWIFKV
tara:strand:+ start:5924 stop:6991 length:1068 start_codon:yes stop_codon:yes gene_type:complete